MKKIIKNLLEWSHTFTGDIVVTGVILVVGLVLAYVISWAMWITGIWG